MRKTDSDIVIQISEMMIALLKQTDDADLRKRTLFAQTIMLRTNSFTIGDIDYSEAENVLALRAALIAMRNEALGPNFNAGLAITFSHVIGFFAAFITARWPERRKDMEAQSA